ncbi:MAG: bifunctional DNA primase/polymerase, partial [Chloroflexia bacterium]|nr:bifunctional DNA primase/polymerase [Chloroflexia bacterium]
MSKQPANPLLTAALEYARLGWPVIPLHHPVDGQCSCGDSTCTHQGKHPRIRRWQHQATCNEATIKKWWASWPNANVGIATGDHLLVIDHDHGELPGEAPTGPVVKTSKGRHYYVQAPNVIVENWVKVNGTGLDLRTSGGLVVAPPSVHISGERYEWINPPEGTLPPAPTWLLDLIAKQAPPPPEPSPDPSQGGGVAPYARAALENERDKVHRAPHGQRNEQLNRSAFALGTLVGAGALDENTVAETLIAAAVVTGVSVN